MRTVPSNARQAGILKAVVLLSCPSVSGGTSEGTGFFIRSDGYLLTNYHVIAEAEEIRVRIPGSPLRAYVRAGNASLDLAVLQVPARASSVLRLGNSDSVDPGDEVLAVGYPLGSFLGADPTVTRGIISSLRRPEDGPPLLQIDAALNPGNSGGPILSSSSREVIGIATAKLTEASNIGFALPSNLCRDFVRRSLGWTP